ncbi:hypothetical protein PQX77_003860 [Marasmius sp. AFHP31]|nr:hypothetical protein PQX77_003860 [Marasmius sp. AFHP31]
MATTNSSKRKRSSISVVPAKIAVDLATAQSYSENVFLFVPNLIGYTRIILAGLSLHFMSYHPRYCTAAYVISCLLDAVDGPAARALGQSSKFGAVLDMVTDRCTTSCLLCYLSIAYPTYAIFFQFLIALDFSSHYMHMYRSHKLVTSDVSRILWLYYNDSRTLFLICAGNELFFVALYLVKWTSTPLPVDLTPLPVVGAWLKGLTYAQAIALLSFPICALKNVINLVQLWKASKILVGVDLAERAKARQEKARRFLSSEVPPPSEPPAELVAESSSPPSPSPSSSSPPAEEPERTKTRRTRPFTSITPKEPEIPELPEELNVLWAPTSDEPVDSTSLPPDDILEEALHNLHVALHPQTQNHAVFASPLGPPTEPSIGLYCPIEGGEYVIDETVRELARRTGAEVLVLDAVQLAAGEWGDFGPAATSLQLPRNPLHFSSSSSVPSTVNQSRQPSTSTHDEDEDLPSSYPPILPQQMMLTFLAPGGGAGPAVVAPSSKRTAPASKVKVFFDALVNIKPKDTSQSTSAGTPRLIYIRDYPTLASTSSTWYPHLLSSIRQRRKGAMSRSSSPVPNPMAIIFGMTPPVAAQNPAWGENPTANSAREKRLRSRLKKWEKGEDILKHEFPRMFPLDEQGDSSRADVIVVGSGASPFSQLAQSLSSRPASDPAENQPSLFRTSTLVPRVRSSSQEHDSRVSRRREINELTMRMGVGAVGGVLQPEAADALLSQSVKPEETSKLDETSEQGQDKSDPEGPAKSDKSARSYMWEDWGNRIETWNEVRRIADRALGGVVATSASERKPTLDRTLVEWQDVKRAWDSVNGTLDSRRSWMKDALPSSQSTENAESEETSKGERDEVIEAVKNDPDLEHHEQRLLPSIVDSASITTTFGQVHLPQHTVDSVRSIVSLPLLHPKAFQHGILKEHSMTGCLLFGPPGTGKTLVVRALAKEAGCRMMVVSPSDVMDMYVGEGEKLVRAVFSLARRLSPCVIFLDEIDALFGARMSARESGSAIAHRGVITEFMQEMDGLKSSKEDNVIVIGATNRPFDLDDAVLRRLPRRMLVDLPGEKERAEILKILLRDETLDSDVDVQALAKRTESFSGSDLKHLCVSAALDAVKEHVHLPWAPTTSAEPTAPTLTTEMEVGSSKTEAKETDATASLADAEQTSEEAEDSSQQHSRVLSKRNFDKALKEITPSSSEALGTLAELRKWNEEFGEGRKDRKRRLIWGKGLFGFNDKGEIPNQDEVRVSPVSVITRGGRTDA